MIKLSELGEYIKKTTNSVKHTLACPSNSLDNVNNLGKCWKVFLAGPNTRCSHPAAFCRKFVCE